MNVLALSSLFPNAEQPQHGIFLKHRLHWLAREPGVSLRVVAPVPWFPSGWARFGRYAKYSKIPAAANMDGLVVSHPRYCVLPKIGMAAAPILMAISMIKQLRALRAEGFDFDVIDAYYAYPDGVAAALLGRWFKRPVVITAFGSDVTLFPKFALPRWQIGWALRVASRATAVCDALRQEVLRRFEAARAVEVIYHGVDLLLFQPSAQRELVRQELGVEGFTLLSVGSLIPRKGHHVAIECLRDLPDVQLCIAGDGSMFEELQALALSLGVEGRVRFLGELPQNLIRDYMVAADALVLCSDREGLANVMMESLACGTPVIATAVWGAPEILTSGVDGVLFQSRTPEGLGAAVQSFRLAPPARASARATAEKYDWQDTAKQHAMVLKTCVGVGSTP
jgi:glycosyltransferase involved in cell wall biosynthesis